MKKTIALWSGLALSSLVFADGCGFTGLYDLQLQAAFYQSANIGFNVQTDFPATISEGSCEYPSGCPVDATMLWDMCFELQGGSDYIYNLLITDVSGARHIMSFRGPNQDGQYTWLEEDINMSPYGNAYGYWNSTTGYNVLVFTASSSGTLQ